MRSIQVVLGATVGGTVNAYLFGFLSLTPVVDVAAAVAALYVPIVRLDSRTVLVTDRPREDVANDVRRRFDPATDALGSW